MRAIAIIPARGGSKRLPRKNIVDFLGRPIIAYTIEAALNSRCFERVAVSTEDSEIANVAGRFGAAVLDRPAVLAGDQAFVVDVCLDALDREQAAGRTYDALCCLYATAPLRDADDIRAVMNMIEPGIHDFAMAVTTFDVPPYRALRRKSDGTLEPMFPDYIGRKSQEVGEVFVNNASTYAAATAAFRRYRTFHGPGLQGYVMPRARSTDIDVADDLEEARARGRRLGLR